MGSQRLKKLALGFLCCLPILAASQQSSDSTKVLALERKWTEAYKQRDIGLLSSLLAEDFAITVEDGSTYGKEGYIGHSADTSVHVEARGLITRRGPRRASTMSIAIG